MKTGTPHLPTPTDGEGNKTPCRCRAHGGQCSSVCNYCKELCVGGAPTEKKLCDARLGDKHCTKVFGHEEHRDESHIFNYAVWSDGAREEVKVWRDRFEALVNERSPDTAGNKVIQLKTLVEKLDKEVRFWRREAEKPRVQDPEKLATKFHYTYERLAPSFGYETRKDTKVFDPNTPNGKLMIAVCKELLS